MLFVSENLQRYFSRYGDVIDCVVMKNSESGRSRGFGFVTFSDPANVSLVLQSGPHQLDGRTVRNRFFCLINMSSNSEFSNVVVQEGLLCSN
jgi:RNA-binding protein Musashi